jgi:hypothetical protein
MKNRIGSGEENKKETEDYILVTLEYKKNTRRLVDRMMHYERVRSFAHIRIYISGTTVVVRCEDQRRVDERGTHSSVLAPSLSLSLSLSLSPCRSPPTTAVRFDAKLNPKTVVVWPLALRRPFRDRFCIRPRRIRGDCTTTAVLVVIVFGLSQDTRKTSERRCRRITGEKRFR